MVALAHPPPPRSTPDATPWLAHHAALLAVARRLCGNAADAHDLVQTAYERALASAQRFKPGTNARAWLVTILRRLFIDEWRRGARATWVPLAEAEELAAPSATEPRPEWDHVSDEALDAAIAALEPPFRAVFRLYALENRSYVEIAQALDIPKATVGTRLVRARHKLRRALTAGATITRTNTPGRSPRRS